MKNTRSLYVLFLISAWVLAAAPVAAQQSGKPEVKEKERTELQEKEALQAKQKAAKSGKVLVVEEAPAQEQKGQPQEGLKEKDFSRYRSVQTHTRDAAKETDLQPSEREKLLQGIRKHKITVDPKEKLQKVPSREAHRKKKQ